MSPVRAGVSILENNQREGLLFRLCKRGGSPHLNFGRAISTPTAKKQNIQIFIFFLNRKPFINKDR